MLHFVKAHAYGNDFLYVRGDEVDGVALDLLAREMCDRHTGIGADGLIVYQRTADGASMRLLNADGSRAEVSGNGVRALCAWLLGERDRQRADAGEPFLDAAELTIQTEAGSKRLTRLRREQARQTFRGAMGLPTGLREVTITAGGETIRGTVMNIGNPQCVVIGPLPEEERFRRLGAAIEHHQIFPEGTNVEFAQVEADTRIRLLIWERGVGPTTSSGTGSCAALVAAAAFGGAARDADVVAPGGAQRVEWRDDNIYLTGWAEVLCEGHWLRTLP
jgi:diaminopimelate epimerase